MTSEPALAARATGRGRAGDARAACGWRLTCGAGGLEGGKGDTSERNAGVVCSAGLLGRGKKREKAQGEMERGPREFWAGWAEGLGLGLISLFYSLFSYFKHYSNLIEFKYKFEFNPSTQPIKEKLQHECTNILTL